MAKPHPHFGQSNRSLFPTHGAGKGDKPRIDDVESFRRNFDRIKFTTSPDGFTKTARGVKKVYKTT